MILIVPRTDQPTLVCPEIEIEMARQMTTVPDIRSWVDGVDGEWPGILESILEHHRPRAIGVEQSRMPGLVTDVVRAILPSARLVDLSPALGEMRTIKDAEEIEASEARKRAFARPPGLQ